MLDSLFSGIFDSSAVSVIPIGQFLLCVAVALVIGLMLAAAYMYRARYTKSFVTTLAILPAVVCVVIMMVNGNIGAGVAVAGAFSLVRFRSVPGTAREIGVLFLAMGAGLVCGMGYLAYAVLFTMLLCLVMVVYEQAGLGGAKGDLRRSVRITIPEDLNYTAVFDEPFEKYTAAHELMQVKTTNLGSMFRLTYHITLASADAEKALIDDLRCRNGNLEILVSRQETVQAEL